MARILVLCTLVAAIMVPAAFAADPVPADFTNAAKYCKALRTVKGVEAFQTHFGSNKNKKNAFGKCVSATAKAKAAQREHAKDDDDEDEASEEKATAACKKQHADDAAKFADDHKNFGQCVKATKDDD